jgi:hypothetical protein
MSQSKLSPSGPVNSAVGLVPSPFLPGGPTPVLTPPGTISPSLIAAFVNFPAGVANSVSVSQCAVNPDGSVAFTLDNAGAPLAAGFDVFIVGFLP